MIIIILSFYFKTFLLTLNRTCGAKRFGKPDPFHIKPKAHAEKKETSKDE